MVSYTQDELSSIWQRAEGDGNRIDPVTGACIRINSELEQTMSIGTVAPYGDFNDGGAPVYYARRKHSKEAPWGEWGEEELR